MRLETYLRISRWHKNAGGSFVRPASHALRLLNEVVELCIASGADWAEIGDTVQGELQKAALRGELGVRKSYDEIGLEYSDVRILLEIYRDGMGINEELFISKKLDILDRRKWQADEHGVLWRPGHGKTPSSNSD